MLPTEQSTVLLVVGIEKHDSRHTPASALTMLSTEARSLQCCRKEQKATSACKSDKPAISLTILSTYARSSQATSSLSSYTE